MPPPVPLGFSRCQHESHENLTLALEVGREGVVMTITNVLAFAPAPPPPILQKAARATFPKCHSDLGNALLQAFLWLPTLQVLEGAVGSGLCLPPPPTPHPCYSHIRLLAVPRMLRAPSLSCLVAFEPAVPSPWNTCPLLFIRKVLNLNVTFSAYLSLKNHRKHQHSLSRHHTGYSFTVLSVSSIIF